jgi:hypothetical protein
VGSAARSEDAECPARARIRLVNPDVAAAVERLRADGVLAPDPATLFGAVARGERLSLRAELQVLLYGGVLLITAGVGELVRQNLDRLGPVAITAALTVAALACLLWVARVAPPFSRGQAPSDRFGFDYVLLLGMLLVSADLAYVETQFTPLGSSWPLHLLVVAGLAALLAFRYDSRTLFSLALASFAAWRGVAISVRAAGEAFWRGPSDELRMNALVCGALFVLLGFLLGRGTVKPHFEPVATHLGWLLGLGALASGGGLSTSTELLFVLALLVVSAGLAGIAVVARRFSLFTLGTLGVYLALVMLLLRTRPEGSAAFLLIALSALGLVGGLIRARAWIREEG